MIWSCIKRCSGTIKFLLAATGLIGSEVTCGGLWRSVRQPSAYIQQRVAPELFCPGFHLSAQGSDAMSASRSNGPLHCQGAGQKGRGSAIPTSIAPSSITAWMRGTKGLVRRCWKGIRQSPSGLESSIIIDHQDALRLKLWYKTHSVFREGGITSKPWVLSIAQSKVNGGYWQEHLKSKGVWEPWKSCCSCLESFWLCLGVMVRAISCNTVCAGMLEDLPFLKMWPINHHQQTVL